MKTNKSMIPFDELSTLFENIKFEHTWTYCNGVSEYEKDERTSGFYLRELYRPNLGSAKEHRVGVLISNEAIIRETDSNKLKISSFKYRIH